MSGRVVSETEFRAVFEAALDDRDLGEIGSVTGPGRSGAVAAVYASHYLGVPFIPYGAVPPYHLGSLLIVDTARQTGKTVRKAVSRYKDFITVEPVIAFEEPPRVAFWYESEKPQRYRHERRVAA